MTVFRVGSGGFAGLVRVSDAPSRDDARVVLLAPDPTRPLHELVAEVRAETVACRAAGQALLLVSSAEAHGRNPFRLEQGAESWVAGGLEGARTRTWLAVEEVVRAAGEEGLFFGIARLGEVYGPGEQGVVGALVDALEDGHALEVEAGELGLCFVDDAVAALRGLAGELADGTSGETVHVAPAWTVSTGFLAAELARLAGRETEVPSALGTRRGPAPSSASGWLPTGLAEGLARTLAARGLRAAEPDPPAIRVPFIRPNVAVGSRLAHRVAAAVHSGRMSNDGPRVAELEERLAGWLGVPEVVVVTSGSMALLAMAATLTRPGAVVLPSFTFPATASAFALGGRELVFADLDPETWTLDPGAIAAAGPVAALVPVTVFGVPADLDGLARVAAELGAELLVDDSHGLGTRCEIPQGTVRTFSLHATKMLAAAEGGAVVGPPERMEAVRRFRNHGRGAELLDAGPGLNARMDELRASLALEQLDGLPAMVARRREDAGVLREALVAAGWRVQRVPDGVVSGFQNLGARLPGVPAERAVAAFVARGIEARRYFHPLLHHTGGFWSDAPLPATEALHHELVCLPLHSHMHPRELAAVRDAIGPVTEELCRKGP